MYIVKNALRSMIRSKGRSILILIIALVIAVSACVTLSIRQSAVRARETGLSDLEITAQIALDRQSLMQSARNGGGEANGEPPDLSSMKDALLGAQGLTLEELQTYAAAPSVKSFYYTLTASMDGSGLEPIDLSRSGDSSSDDADDAESADGSGSGSGGGNPFGGKGMGGMAGLFGAQGDFTLIGAGSDEALTDFVSGVCSITDGAMFAEGTEERECVISDELATLNDLSVGETVTLVNPNDETETIDFTIAGIYHNSTAGTQESGGMAMFSAAGDSANRIYVSYAALKAFTDESAANASTETDEETGREQNTAVQSQISGTYVFADAEDYEAFEAEARALGLDDSYSVFSTEVSQYERSLQPLENLSKFALYFLIVVLIIGAVILIVINIFSIRERKYEIGVLTAIGMSKARVALQFVTEMFSITLAAVLLGAVIGGVASVPVSNALLESQITSQEQKSDDIRGNFGREMGGGPGGSLPDDADIPSGGADFKGGFFGGAANYISEVNASVDFTVLAQLLGISVLLTLLSSGAALIFILRYEPLKILSNRD